MKPTARVAILKEIDGKPIDENTIYEWWCFQRGERMVFIPADTEAAAREIARRASNSSEWEFIGSKRETRKDVVQMIDEHIWRFDS